MRRVEQLTDLSFGSLADYDPLAQREAAVDALEVERLTELVL